VPYITPLLSGLALYGLFFAWKKAASRWSTWFPLLKKTLEWAFLGVAVVVAGNLLMDGLNTTADTAMYWLAFGAGLALPIVLTRKSLTEKEETKRGSTQATAAQVTRQVKATKKPTFLTMGEVPVPVESEPYHFLMVGSTGTGKSVAIGNLLETIRERGDTALLVDSGGGFLSKYYDPETDFVFNPYDDRCVGWSPAAEMQGAWDAQALARSIVPDGVGDSKEWNSYAQTFIGSLLRKLWETNRLNMRDFLYYVQAAPISELQTMLEGTAAAGQMASEKTFGSIRTIASNYVTSYDYLPANKPVFSISKMIEAEHSGVLFISYRDDQLDSLRNLMACALDVASRTILSLKPDPDRRIWLIIDEFASIGKVQSIEAVATKARKAGGCLVLGIQSISQLKDRYGDHGAQTILSCLSTWLVLRCSDADTAEYMSKYIGDAEIKRTQQGASTSDSGESTSWNEQSSTQRVVLASQIQQQPNLTGMLKLAGDFPVCQVKLPFPKKGNANALAFEPRDFDANPLMNLKPVAKPTKVAPAAPQEEEAPQKAERARAADPAPEAPPAQQVAKVGSIPLSTLYQQPRKNTPPGKGSNRNGDADVPGERQMVNTVEKPKKKHSFAVDSRKPQFELPSSKKRRVASEERSRRDSAAATRKERSNDLDLLR
jgi:hypothetical protein